MTLCCANLLSELTKILFCFHLHTGMSKHQHQQPSLLLFATSRRHSPFIAAQEVDKTPQESRRETEQEESFEIKSQVSDLTDDTDREEVTSTANLKATKRKHIDTTTSIAHGGDSKEMTFAKLLRYTQKGAELH